ncbi:MAG TPA: maleylacetate reductase [Alphaproteobacteria bacterium]|nr:maleylacetate reductase [Alphaproteobacteria bacterium]
MYQGKVVTNAMEQVVYGIAAAEAVNAEAERLDAQRVFLMVSAALDQQTDEIARIRDRLGPRFAGQYSGMPPHTPREAVIEVARRARAVAADLLVTIGGGSLTDGGKVVQICLANDIDTVEGLDPYRLGTRNGPRINAPEVRQISVPTTLSGGEFNALGGCTDTARGMKEGYTHPLCVPRAVLLDPALSVHTPEWLWLSTGIRAVDHCVETLCSLASNPYADGIARSALALLAQGLRGVKVDPGDLDARQNCQIGVWQAMIPLSTGVPMGASHAIGHVLGGACNVPHGYTSCVMLPNVMRWNEPANAERQRQVAAALGRPDLRPCDAVRGLIRDLELPCTLADVSVGAAQFQEVAEKSMHDHWIHSNPRPIAGPDAVMEILTAAA